MALTVVKYRKTATGEITSTPSAILIKNKLPVIANQQHQIIKKPIVKLDSGTTGLIINKIPATIKPAIKRDSTSAIVEPVAKTAKYALQTISSTGTPLTRFQWQQTIGGAGNTVVTSTGKQQLFGTAISSLPPNTIIKPANIVKTENAASYIQANGNVTVSPSAFNALTTQSSTAQIRRPTIYVKREVTKRTIRSVTLELIENNPLVHLGLTTNRLAILKNIICATANVSLLDCYLTLKKLRQNESFALLGEYFELSENEVQQIIVRTIIKLARYLRHLIRWPNSKRYYDRHKDIPFAYRLNLSYVQLLIEVVETDLPRLVQVDCSNYKFILCMTPNNIISYVSEVYLGQHDDLAIFTAANFKSVVPKYLSLVANPGKGIRRKRKSKTIANSKKSNNVTESDSTTDSADELIENNIETDDDTRMLSKFGATRIVGELASNQTLHVDNDELTSCKVKDLTIPTVELPETLCRQQINSMINNLREFKIMQSQAIQEDILYQYLSDIVIIVAALTNLQR